MHEMKSMNSFLVLAILSIVCLTPNAIAQRRFYRQQQAQCVTPENYWGTCVALSYCPQVVNVFYTQPQHIAQQSIFQLQRSCGTRNIRGDPVVCCTRPSGRPVRQPVTQAPNPFYPTTPVRRPVAQPARPPTTAPPTSPPNIDSRAIYCRDPDTREGTCMALEKCTDLYNQLIAKQRDTTFKNYLRASKQICGQTDTHVCCPSKAQPTSALKATRAPFTNEVPRRLPTVEEGCGYTASSFKKIVGGEVSKIGAWPWATLIGYDDGLSASPFKCGGTLITARHVMTAAHCIRKDLTFVRLGEHDLTRDTETKHVDVRVVRMESHSQYNRRNGRNDIAILYLERNVEFSDFVAPICLPITESLRRKNYENYTPFVVGWGKTMEGGTSATVLQELQIPIYSNDVCYDKYKEQKRLISSDQFNEGVICAGVLTGGKDTCQGDSGGPLMIPEPYANNVRYYLIGVVSYGIGCARPDVPGVYTSTQYFMDWITQKIADSP